MTSFSAHFEEKYQSSIFHAREPSDKGLQETSARKLGLCANIMRVPAFGAAAVGGFIGGITGLLACAYKLGISQGFYRMTFNDAIGTIADISSFFGRVGYASVQAIGHGMDTALCTLDAGTRATIKTAMLLPLDSYVQEKTAPAYKAPESAAQDNPAPLLQAGLRNKFPATDSTPAIQPLTVKRPGHSQLAPARKD